MSGIGASELWSVLRNKSQMKLEKQDDVIPVDVKVHAHAQAEPMGDLVRRCVFASCLLRFIKGVSIR